MLEDIGFIIALAASMLANIYLAVRNAQLRWKNVVKTRDMTTQGTKLMLFLVLSVIVNIVLILWLINIKLA